MSTPTNNLSDLSLHPSDLPPEIVEHLSPAQREELVTELIKEAESFVIRQRDKRYGSLFKKAVAHSNEPVTWKQLAVAGALISVAVVGGTLLYKHYTGGSDVTDI